MFNKLSKNLYWHSSGKISLIYMRTGKSGAFVFYNYIWRPWAYLKGLEVSETDIIILYMFCLYKNNASFKRKFLEECLHYIRKHTKINQNTTFLKMKWDFLHLYIGVIKIAWLVLSKTLNVAVWKMSAKINLLCSNFILKYYWSYQNI